MFTPRLIVNIMSKMVLFFVFSANDCKTSVTVWTKYLCASGRSYLVLSENAMEFWILSYHQQDVNRWRYRISLFHCWLSSFFIFLPSISLEWQLQTLLIIPFSEKKFKNILGGLQFFSQTWLIFCCHQQKIQKYSRSSHLNDHNSQNNHDN